MKRGDFLKLAKARKTTYKFNSDKAIKKNDVNLILEAGRWAPSVFNLQPWHFIVVKEKSMIVKLMENSLHAETHTPPSLLIAIVLNPHCGNPEEHRDLCLAMPASNMVFEAESLGICSCILSPNEKNVSQLLDVPNSSFVILMVGFGYEKKGTKHKKRERKPLKELVSYEKFESKP